MRTRLLLLMILSATISCGGGPLPSPDVEVAPPDSLQISTWPDATDLGEVVSSGILQTDDRPPAPDFER